MKISLILSTLLVSVISVFSSSSALAGGAGPTVTCSVVVDEMTSSECSSLGDEGCHQNCCHPFFKKKTKTEVCRRYFTRTLMTCGRCCITHYVEITCQTMDSCGRVRLTRQVRRVY